MPSRLFFAFEIARDALPQPVQLCEDCLQPIPALAADLATQERSVMKAIWNGAVIAQSDDIVTIEGNHYFPESALNRDHVTFSNHHTMCAWKGQASYYSLLVNGEMNTDAAWYYPDPKPEAEEIKGRIAFWKGVKIEA